MVYGMNPVETGADIDRAWVAAVSEGQRNDSMHTTPSKFRVQNYGIDGHVTILIAWSDFKRLMLDKADGLCAERNQAAFQAQKKNFSS